MNIESGLLEKVSISGVDFCQLDVCGPEWDERDTVAVIVQGSGFLESLVKACDMNVPVVALAGTFSEFGQAAYKEARSCGVPEAAIVYKNGNVICNHSGHQFIASVKKGVGPLAVLELANFAWQERLIPEPVILWMPPEEVLPSPIDGKPSLIRSVPSVKIDTKMPGGKEKEDSILQLSINGLIDDAGLILLAIRTMPSYDESGLARILSGCLHGVHVEVAQHPAAYKEYQLESLADVIEKCPYGYSDGSHVRIHRNQAARGTFIIDIEPNELPPELLEHLHERARYVVHIADEFSVCKGWIDDWIMAGGRLDAILTKNETEKSAFEAHYPKLAMNVVDFANRVSVQAPAAIVL